MKGLNKFLAANIYASGQFSKIGFRVVHFVCKIPSSPV